MPKPTIHRRRWAGYGLVVATVLFALGLWIASLWRADAWYDTPWKYPAKVGSHGALMLMCWAFILATRFRPVEWLFGGLDKVYKAHRRIGQAAFALIFLHPVFLAVAFTDSAGGFLRYLWFSGDWVRNTGIVALAAFVLLVVLSLHVEIAYHKWKRTHDFFGLLLVLVVVHAAISGGEIVGFPVLAAWHGVWVGVALAAYVYIRLLYRWFGPLYDFRVVEARDAGADITELLLDPVGRPMPSAPGQFAYISLDSTAVSEEPHPFSLSSPSGARRLRFSIKRLGDWTSEVGGVRPGEHARVWGPYGHFSEELFKQPGVPAVMIGGGVGITPFLSIILSAEFGGRPGPSTLVYAVPRRSAAAYSDELRAAAEGLPRLRFAEHLSDEQGYIDRDYLEGLLDQPLPKHLFFLCGPGPMMDAVSDVLEDAGVPRRQILFEDFDIV